MPQNPTYDDLTLKVKELEAIVSKYKHEVDTHKKDEKRHRAVFEHMLHEVHVWELVFDENHNIKTWKLIDANPAACKSWGKKLSDIVGKTTNEIFTGFNATEYFLPIVNKIFSENKPHIWETYFAATNQHLHMISIPLDNYFISTGLDITQRKINEEELRDTTLKLKESIEAGNIGLWNWNLIDNKVFYSTEWKKQIGFEDNEIGDAFDEWKSRVHPDDLEKSLEIINSSIENAESNFEIEFRFLHKNGSYINILSHGSIILDDNGKPVRILGSHIDISERIKVEQALQLSSKLESIGTLAGGIAHDFNNLLSSIYGNIELAKVKSDNEEINTFLTRSIDSIERAQSLTSQLLTFSEGGAPIKKHERIKSILEKTVNFTLSGSSIICKFIFSENLKPCYIDKNQISQVIDNLVINAKQSMPDGGTVYLSAENVDLEKNSIKDLPEGHYVKITLRDEGVGISDENLPKIFDPFYSTKSEGYGIGLTTAYSIVDRHGGAIEVESEVNKGTTFCIYLPAVNEEDVFEESYDSNEHKGKGLFIVMDDEKPILDVFEEVLSGLGYSVITKQKGEDVLQFVNSLDEPQKKITGMLFDLTIPGAMGGKETVIELRKILKDTPIFVSSGYSNNPIMSHPEKYGFTSSIVKPFRIKDLLAKLNEYISL